MKAWLLICESNKIIDCGVVAWGDYCCNRLISKSKKYSCDLGEYWLIKKENRRKFGVYLDKVLSESTVKTGDTKEELYGFFTVAGLGKKWADDDTVDWCLMMSDKEIKNGINIGERNAV